MTETTTTTVDNNDLQAVPNTSSIPSTVRIHPLTVLKVDYELNDSNFSGEGRTITIEFPDFYLINCYVPNSGQRLERLKYRTEEWDPYFFEYLKSLEATGKSIILTGDLNVAHLDLDIHNPTAKHISKQSGLTPQERQSFSSRLATGFQDALRYFYPGISSCFFLFFFFSPSSHCYYCIEHEGQFTWWSIRTNGRAENKGLRLDYFICSKSMFLPLNSTTTTTTTIATTNNITTTPQNNDGNIDAVATENGNDTTLTTTTQSRAIVRDSTILHEFGVGCSDHCPILLLLEIPENQDNVKN